MLRYELVHGTPMCSIRDYLVAICFEFKRLSLGSWPRALVGRCVYTFPDRARNATNSPITTQLKAAGMYPGDASTRLWRFPARRTTGGGFKFRIFFRSTCMRGRLQSNGGPVPPACSESKTQTQNRLEYSSLQLYTYTVLMGKKK